MIRGIVRPVRPRREVTEGPGTLGTLSSFFATFSRSRPGSPPSRCVRVAAPCRPGPSVPTLSPVSATDADAGSRQRALPQPVRARLLRQPVRPVRPAAGGGARPPEPARAVDADPVRRRQPAAARPVPVGGGRQRQHRPPGRPVRGGRDRAGPAREPGHPQPRPARPHPDPAPGLEGVHTQPHRRARAPRRAPRQRAARRARRAAAGGEPVDLIRGLAFPLPFAVISEMLGMPETDRDQLRDWSHTIVKLLEPIDRCPRSCRRLIAAGDRMDAHVRDAIAWKRANPADDLLSALIAAEEEGDVLSEDELLDQVRLLYIAGHETTVNLIGNGTLALLRHRDQLELPAPRPDARSSTASTSCSATTARCSSRAASRSPTSRSTATRIEPGSFVFTLLGAANHDPAHFGADGRRSSTSAGATRRTTSRSAAASTTASARCSHGRRAASRSARSSGASPTSSSPTDDAGMERPHGAARPRRAPGRPPPELELELKSPVRFVALACQIGTLDVALVETVAIALGVRGRGRFGWRLVPGVMR